MSTRKCVFSTSFIREEVDPRVQEAWRETYRTNAPFAKLRQMWKTHHCVQVDPYNTGCPYAEQDCAMSFLVAVERTVGFHPERPTGYFRAVAHSMGLDRADNKPLARDTLSRTDVHKEGHSSSTSSGHREGRGRGARVAPNGDGIHQGERHDMASDSPDLHRTSRGPVRIGELLGALDLRPHQRPSKDEQEGDK